MNRMHAAAITIDMLAAIPPGAQSSFKRDARTTIVPASRILDKAWMDEQIRLRSLIWNIDDPFILGTLWWYSASNWLVLPTIASSFITGTPLSPALDDILLHWRSDSRISGAESIRVLGPLSCVQTLATALAGPLTMAVERVASICGKGERRLWSIAVDSIAGHYLWLGTATGRIIEAKEAANQLVTQLPGSLPQPRFQTVKATSTDVTLSETFIRRGSCCLLYQVSGEHYCVTCPRQHPNTRLERLQERMRIDGYRENA